MRNIFDQYSQPENRVTHALMTALNEDRPLLGQFLKDVVNLRAAPDPQSLVVLEQQFPFEEEVTEEEVERLGIPDGWIFNNDGWCVFIETKVISKLTADQLIRHRRTAERRGFHNIIAVAIAPLSELPSAAPEGTLLIQWTSIYVFLKRRSESSEWARRAAEFLEIIEAKLIESKQFREGTLTMFSGFPFGIDHSFTYLEAKRVLALAMSELKARDDLATQLGMDPNSAGRPAITGRQADAVWDFLSFVGHEGDAGFTSFPHLTLSIGMQSMSAMVTVPHKVNSVMRSNIVKLGIDGFRKLTEEVVANLIPVISAFPGATPWFRGVQRRYPSQRATPFIDATIDFDLRTAIKSEGGSPKTQPTWLAAAYESFVDKKTSNYQIQMGMLFRYDRCPELSKSEAIEAVASAWLGCKPLIDLAKA